MKINGINLHVVMAGPQDGKLVILLHGFPEFWYGWRKQIPALAAAGYTVWAPDQRGYNVSDKPQGLDAYQMDLLAADVVGLIDAAGREQAIVVGHDWGAGVTWRVAHQHPDRVEKAVILNVPHPWLLAKTAGKNWRQALRSSYMLYFQLPGIPERMMQVDNWQPLVDTMQGSSQPGTFSRQDMAAYRQAWSQPGAMTAMLNWYRAALQRPPSWSPSPRIRVPTLMIWGAGDRFLGRELAPPSIDLCDDGRLVFVEDATHWVQHEAPDRVNALLLDFFASTAPNYAPAATLAG
jgi:epoxide hydrolase 4